MWKIGRIDHVVLWVRDLEKSMKFYEALGFEIDWKSYEDHLKGKIPFVACKAGPNSRIDLRPDPNWRPVAREKGNMQHFNVVIDVSRTSRSWSTKMPGAGFIPTFRRRFKAGPGASSITIPTTTASRWR
jgi:catechol 2,3-dioxygenase-like lactoylglutathione lyase family enzyme